MLSPDYSMMISISGCCPGAVKAFSTSKRSTNESSSINVFTRIIVRSWAFSDCSIKGPRQAGQEILEFQVSLFHDPLLMEVCIGKHT